MKVKNKLKKLIKENVFIRKIARKVYFLKCNMQYKIITKKLNVDDKLIIFASFNGRSYCDSPKALYEYLIKDKKYENYKFVWSLKDV